MPLNSASLLDTSTERMTFQELLKTLRQEDEVTLLEILELNSNDLVDKCLDEIEEHMPRILRLYEEF